MNTKIKRFLTLSVVLLAAFSIGFAQNRTTVVHASDSNFSDGITVDSTADNADSSIGDSICDDGSGSCTLRAAIEESNNTPGTQTIRFNITGSADFVNGGQDGYTIKPTSSFPDITDTVTIDGYSQPGSQANTAVTPNPLNGRLLIQVDGINAGSSKGFVFINNSDMSTIKGLIINDFTANAVRVEGADAVKIQGNYIGTDFTGMNAMPNGSDDINSSTAVSIGENGLGTMDTTTTNTLLGGLNPEDRNLISGNYGGGGGIGAVDTSILGNYVGVASDGITDLGNSYGAGVTTGGFTVDYADGVFFGGPQAGAKNVISGNATGGIQPDFSTRVIVESNYIGTDYTGKVAVPNGINGVGFARGSGISGIVRNNIIMFNQDGGVSVSASGNVQIIGNTISGNSGFSNVRLAGTPNLISNNVIRGNKIGTNPDGSINPSFTQGIGISLSGNVKDNVIGGTNEQDINIIASNSSVGIAVIELNITGLGVLSPSENTILGNRIFSSKPGNIFGFNLPGLGIDHASMTLNGFTPQSIAHEGPTLNDSGDADTGPNNYLNFPVINSTSATAGNLDINFNLDVDDSASGYRIEFFASNTADLSGYGEGQIYLGSVDVAAGGTNLKANLAIPSSFANGSYAITATTTEKDASTDGFGSTSEFSAVLGAQTVLAASSTTNPISAPSTGLATTGISIGRTLLIGCAFISASLALFKRASYKPFS